MGPRIVVGLFQSEGIAEDACNRLKTEGVPAADIVRNLLKEIGLPPEAMEPELEAGFLGPFILGGFRKSTVFTVYYHDFQPGTYHFTVQPCGAPADLVDTVQLAPGSQTYLQVQAVPITSMHNAG